jgi:hypothetical protein
MLKVVTFIIDYIVYILKNCTTRISQMILYKRSIMIKRIILGILILFSFVISGCNFKNSTVEVTPTLEATEEIIVDSGLGE